MKKNKTQLLIGSIGCALICLVLVLSLCFNANSNKDTHVKNEKVTTSKKSTAHINKELQDAIDEINDEIANNNENSDENNDENNDENSVEDVQLESKNVTNDTVNNTPISSSNNTVTSNSYSQSQTSISSQPAVSQPQQTPTSQPQQTAPSTTTSNNSNSNVPSGKTLIMEYDYIRIYLVGGKSIEIWKNINGWEFHSSIGIAQ